MLQFSTTNLVRIVVYTVNSPRKQPDKSSTTIRVCLIFGTGQLYESDETVKNLY